MAQPDELLFWAGLCPVSKVAHRQLTELGFSGVRLIFWVGPAWLPLLGLPLFASANALQLRYKKTKFAGNRLCMQIDGWLGCLKRKRHKLDPVQTVAKYWCSLPSTDPIKVRRRRCVLPKLYN